MKKSLLLFAGLLCAGAAFAQSPLYIPPALSGTTFNLDIQQGNTTFFTGFNTQTYGINGVLLAPTLIINKGDSVTLNVTNNLPVKTTIHWHGLHVPAHWDGGPHSPIAAGTTWSPRIKMMNDAATYWYHPHGDMKTELHVSKGLAGMLIVKDAAEAALTLPRTYGVDDFPVIVQSKGFDVLQQIAIATELDTTMMVNGTIKPYLQVPAQVVRLRLLNGSTMRNYLFGLTANQPFKLIATDDGLLDTATTLTRIRLSPGERVEILVDLGGMTGQTIHLVNYGSELQNGIYGAAIAGTGAAAIMDYNMNPLNGTDFDVLQLDVVSPTASPVTTMPTTLVPFTPLPEASAQKFRTKVLEAEAPVDSGKLTMGPFLFNGMAFGMDAVNDTVFLGHTEVWTLINTTLVAHPFHIHDVLFYVLDINGAAPPLAERGKKDVVLVQPGDTVRFIARFDDFADAEMPYMYHCHMLHHEDEGMMGSFVVVDSATLNTGHFSHDEPVAYPNPGATQWNIALPHGFDAAIVCDMTGRQLMHVDIEHHQHLVTIINAFLPKGNYIVRLVGDHEVHTLRVVH